MTAPVPGDGRSIMPGVLINARPLLPPTADQLVRVVVDTHVQLPGTFEITFHDPDGIVVEELGAVVGAPVVITGSSDEIPVPVPLIEGEITSIEANCEEQVVYTVLRGYQATHRLQRAKHTRVLREVSDVEAAEIIAAMAGLPPDPANQVAIPPLFHEVLVQANQTDWEFLSYRAAEIGYEFGIGPGGLFYFRPATGGPSLETVESVVAGAKLVLRDNLFTFEPRVSGANLTTSVEARIWDPLSAEALSADFPIVSQTAVIEAMPEELAAMSGKVQAPDLPPEDVVPLQAMAHFGTPTMPGAFRIVDRPVGQGADGWKAAAQLAWSLSNRIGGSFARAEGFADGNPAIQAGTTVEVIGVPAPFTGIWVVSQARHIFDNQSLGGYRTRFWSTGRHNNTLHGLAGHEPPPPPRINGFCCGIVTDNLDPLQLRRVKVALPWLSQSYVSDWARVVQLGAGNQGGALFMPAVGDEVLIGFEFGDMRRPYVVGGLVNATTPYHLVGFGPVPPQEPGVTFPVRGYISPSGNRLSFIDETTPGVPPVPVASSINLTDVTGLTGLTVNPTVGAVTLTTRTPDAPEPMIEIASGAHGAIAITVDAAGTIVISAGEGGNMILNGGETLTLTAKAITAVAEGGPVSLAGSTVQVTAEAEAGVTAPIVNLGA